MDRCRTEVPALDPVGGDPGHLSACWLPHDMRARNALRKEVTGQALPRPAEEAAARAEALAAPAETAGSQA